MKSQAFHLTAQAFGHDLVWYWDIKGYKGNFIYPWEKGPIDIHGVELLVWPSLCKYFWFMVGNSDTPDIMLMAHGSERRVVNWFPKPFVFNSKPALAYLDLHCRAVGFASVFLNFYYEAAK